MNKKFSSLAGVAIALAQITSATPTPTVNQVETTKTENKDQRQTSPMFDPKRPHPIQSYRSQQRAAKQRKKAR